MIFIEYVLREFVIFLKKATAKHSQSVRLRLRLRLGKAKILFDFQVQKNKKPFSKFFMRFYKCFFGSYPFHRHWPGASTKVFLNAEMRRTQSYAENFYQFSL
jgi:hypothetical protein